MSTVRLIVSPTSRGSEIKRDADRVEAFGDRGEAESAYLALVCERVGPGADAWPC